MFRPLSFLLLLATVSATIHIDDEVLNDALAGDTHTKMLVHLEGWPDLSPAKTMSGTEKGQWVVETLKEFTSKSQRDIVEFLSSNDDVKYFRPFFVSNTITVTANMNVLEQLFNFTNIAKIESDKGKKMQLPEPEEPLPHTEAFAEWGVEYIQAHRVWSLGITGNGGRVGNADTGILDTHAVLQGNYAGGNGNHNFAWWDAVKQYMSPGSGRCGINSQIPCDDNGHGTHTVSTSVGVNGIGVAPNATWLGCRNMERGLGNPSSYLGCLEWFMAPTDLNGNNGSPALRPHVISNSYGCPSNEGCNTGTFSQAVDAVRASGIVMSASAGNAGSSCGSVNQPPALEPLVCSVAASNYLSDTAATFSSRGPATTGSGYTHRSPDITAPGVSVRGAWSNGGYNTISGTSMAAPHVAGAIALIVEACPGLAYNVDALEDLIYSTARTLYTTQSCGGDGPQTTPNNVFGYGMLDVFEAVQRCRK